MVKSELGLNPGPTASGSVYLPSSLSAASALLPHVETSGPQSLKQFFQVFLISHLTQSTLYPEKQSLSVLKQSLSHQYCFGQCMGIEGNAGEAMVGTNWPSVVRTMFLYMEGYLVSQQHTLDIEKCTLSEFGI